MERTEASQEQDQVKDKEETNKVERQDTPGAGSMHAQFMERIPRLERAHIHAQSNRAQSYTILSQS